MSQCVKLLDIVLEKEGCSFLSGRVLVGKGHYVFHLANEKRRHLHIAS